MFNWIKKKVMNWVIDAVMEAIIVALGNMAKNTTSKVDNKMVKLLAKEQETLKADILGYING